MLTTHYLDEADQLAERIIVIDHGRIIADDTPSRLKSRLVGDRISLEFGHESDARRAVIRLGGFVAGAQIRHDGVNVVIEADGGARRAPKLLRCLDEAGIAVVSVEVARPTLDDVFLNLTGRSLREDGPTSATGATVSASQKEIAA